MRSAGRPTGAASDAMLIAAARRGNQSAFCQLVDRYKSLVCAVAFNVTGSALQSEEIGQEVFVLAWSQLSELREGGRFRNWLCSIARRRGQRFRREQRLRPLAEPGALRSALALPSSERSPIDQVIDREEEALIWRALDQMPEPYRLTLAFYYREEKSIKSVAGLLELSEASVEKRLSRGRRLLLKEVLALLESGPRPPAHWPPGTTTPTKPGKRAVSSMVRFVSLPSCGLMSKT